MNLNRWREMTKLQTLKRRITNQMRIVNRSIMREEIEKNTKGILIEGRGSTMGIKEGIKGRRVGVGNGVKRARSQAIHHPRPDISRD